MKLVEQHIIKSNHKYYKELRDLMHISKNLYNTALYEIRQYYFDAKDDDSKKYKYLNYYAIWKLLKDRNDENYRALDSHCAQETLKILDQNFSSFFALLKKKNAGLYTERVRIPKYLSKEGHFLLQYSQLSYKFLEDGIIKIPKTKMVFYTKKRNIKMVRFIPKNGYIVFEVIYEVDDIKLKQDNGNYLSIDLGLNNLATCTSNFSQSFIINGKPLKSINQYYNKKLAKLKSELEIKNNKKSSKQTQKLTLKRNSKIKDYLHKTSKYIINQAVNKSLNTIIIGKNKEWKQEINIGRVNNQNFVQIPFNQLISLLSYKAKLKGINVLLQEESYTSKASFLDNDNIPTFKKGQIVSDEEKQFSGKRIKRGLYQSQDGKLLNADVNGSLNILRKNLKVASDDLLSPTCRGLVFNPVKINF